jgi:tripartite-type tricarboxylate transporter receptor subunit TctC
MMMMKIERRAALGGLIAMGLGGRAQAAAWPTEAISWIVPLAAGGVNDAFARPIAAQVGPALGQTVIVDNKSGAGGTLGAAVAARAAPDGYTMLVGNTAHTYAPLIYPKAGFDLLRDFAPISAFARVQQALVVNPAVLDVATLDQFIALARKKPASIDVGSAGMGTINHLAIELLEDKAKIELSHAPYRGGGPALQDLLAGNIGAIFNPIANLIDWVQKGKLRVLGIAGRRREPLLPDVPTMDEEGLKDFRAVAWIGLFAPKRTPAAILDRMHGAMQAAIVADPIRRAWAEQGAKVEPESREDFARFVGQEVERWTRIARATEIDMD